jgi:hypothetical protein
MPPSLFKTSKQMSGVCVTNIGQKCNKHTSEYAINQGLRCGAEAALTTAGIQQYLNIFRGFRLALYVVKDGGEIGLFIFSYSIF